MTHERLLVVEGNRGPATSGGGDGEHPAAPLGLEWPPSATNNSVHAPRETERERERLRETERDTDVLVTPVDERERDTERHGCTCDT